MLHCSDKLKNHVQYSAQTDCLTSLANPLFIPDTETINEWPISFRILHLSYKSDGNQFKTLRSLQIFPHAMTAVLSWHVQNLVVVTLLRSCIKSKNTISIEWIIVSKTDPHLHYHTHKSSGPWQDFSRASCYVTSDNLSIIQQIIYDGHLVSLDT